MSATAAKASSTTSQTFVTSLVTNVALLAVEVGAFTILKSRLGRIYTPRTFLPPPDKRAQELPTGIWRWVPAVLLSNPKDIIHKNGLDAYMFLRWMKMVIIIFFVFTLVTWPILLPVDAADVRGSSQQGLTKLSWSNITSSLDNRLAAHIVVIYLLTFFVFYMIRREMLHFVHIRHQYLISKSHSHQARARTVLVTSLPEELGEEHQLREFASFVPGGVEHIWIYRDTKELNKKFEERQKACAQLEKACSKLLRTATKNWNRRQSAHTKEVKKVDKMRRKGKLETDAEKLNLPQSVFDPDPLKPQAASLDSLKDLVPESQWPRHRIGPLHALGIGRKVDTIEYCKDEIGRLNEEIDQLRHRLGNEKPLGSAFIECNLQLGAHVLAQCVSYHEPLMMADKWLEVTPRDVIWKNLDDGAYEVRTRYVISWAATIALIILWAFPVAFVGTVSNLEGLCSEARWLRWVCKAPTPVPGIITGVLPPILLAILMLLLPMILRFLAVYECIPLHSLVDVSVYKRYFALLVIHGFLIVTLTSGITSAIAQILATPAQAVENLARNLPNAAIFFLTYMATQGLSGAASALIQLGPLIMHYVKKWFLGRTPRQAYGVTFLMPSADFGTTLPRLSLLATIGFAYSVISPLINGLALLGFSLLYVAWKFLLTQVFDQPEEAETGGLYFPIAVSNFFVGLYIEQICLACLFFLKVPGAITAPTVSAAGPIVEGVLMLILLAITFAYQLLVTRSFKRTCNGPRIQPWRSLIIDACSYHGVFTDVPGDKEDGTTIQEAQHHATSRRRAYPTAWSA
ncbi:DUF221-domain-containing protein [Punctularia strigosozonata HHB-11173 SS5]|uniref:DUF221-domain-containing protein n=1 Tax=Punctularia strigosozonata (strain HHB-11173) TaxID=741275 RepID=UPI00044169BA|nr:DUF221-domain-containing protein [Punctularia strigosozonata HHB-11173 SS5]EIN07902.1 DUF221-domain-containing protein [Punctularia strigosozonata HHB-11173 SS5]